MSKYSKNIKHFHNHTNSIKINKDDHFFVAAKICCKDLLQRFAS